MARDEARRLHLRQEAREVSVVIVDRDLVGTTSRVYY